MSVKVQLATDRMSGETVPSLHYKLTVTQERLDSAQAGVSSKWSSASQLGNTPKKKRVFLLDIVQKWPPPPPLILDIAR